MANGWWRMVTHPVRLSRAPIRCPSGGGGTRETGGTMTGSLVRRRGTRERTVVRSIGWARTSFNEDGRKLDRRWARGLTLVRENQGANWGFSEGKAYLYHGLFFFYESQQEASIEQDSTGEGGSGMHRALDDWMLTRVPALPAQGLHRHGPQNYNFPHFYCLTCMCPLGIDPVDQDWFERDLSTYSVLLLRALAMGWQ